MAFIKKINFKNFFLIFLSIVCIFEFMNIGFEGNWDSYFSVSSEKDSVHYVTYLLQTLIYGFHYYSGAWVILFSILTFLVFNNKTPFDLQTTKQKSLFLIFSFTYIFVHAAVFYGDNYSIIMGTGLYHVIMNFFNLGVYRDWETDRKSVV